MYAVSLFFNFFVNNFNGLQLGIMYGSFVRMRYYTFLHFFFFPTNLIICGAICYEIRRENWSE